VIETTATFDGMVEVCIPFDCPGLSEAERLSLALVQKKETPDGTETRIVEPLTNDPTAEDRLCGETDGFSSFAVGVPEDSDGDGQPDLSDNCTAVANGPDVPDPGGSVQLDRDGDGIGNACDCDFDNDGACTISDFSAFLEDFVSGADSGAGTDMTGDGSVTIADFNFFLTGLVAGEPGPSGGLP
jgi:hypothetical protein